MERLVQVVYFSDRVETPELGATDEIVSRIEARHVALGITGFVFALGGCFISVLEGDHDNVMSRMEQLAADPSHQRMVVLREGAVGRRQFVSWKSSNLDAGPSDEHNRRDAQAFASRLSKGLRMATAAAG